MKALYNAIKLEISHYAHISDDISSPAVASIDITFNTMILVYATTPKVFRSSHRSS